MGYTLRTGVTYCLTDGFVFFLDLDRDRYFAIGGESVSAFLPSEAGARSDDEALFHQLCEDGLLIAIPGPSLLAPCRHEHFAVESALDLAPDLLPRSATINALIRLWRARRTLRWRGLAATLNEMAVRKAKLNTGGPKRTALATVAAAFERSKNLVSPLDQCVPHSVALAHCLLDRGIVPTLIIGVRAQPFAAHCWVEAGGLIAGDRYDTVRAFTPILTL